MAALLAARASLALLRPVGTFLTAPPEPLRSHNYYGHDHREAKPPRGLSLVDRNVA